MQHKAVTAKLYAADGSYLGHYSGLSVDDILERYNANAARPVWGTNVLAVKAVSTSADTRCAYCQDTGIMMHRTAVQLEAGSLTGTTYFEDVEGDCSYCSEARRLDKLEIEVDELVGTVKLLVKKLTDAFDIDFQNFPRSTSEQDPFDREIPF